MHLIYLISDLKGKTKFCFLRFLSYLYSCSGKSESCNATLVVSENRNMIPEMIRIGPDFIHTKAPLTSGAQTRILWVLCVSGSGACGSGLIGLGVWEFGGWVSALGSLPFVEELVTVFGLWWCPLCCAWIVFRNIHVNVRNQVSQQNVTAHHYHSSVTGSINLFLKK